MVSFSRVAIKRGEDHSDKEMRLIGVRGMRRERKKSASRTQVCREKEWGRSNDEGFVDPVRLIGLVDWLID